MFLLPNADSVNARNCPVNKDSDFADTSAESKPSSSSDDDRIASAMGENRLIMVASS